MSVQSEGEDKERKNNTLVNLTFCSCLLGHQRLVMVFFNCCTVACAIYWRINYSVARRIALLQSRNLIDPILRSKAGKKILPAVLWRGRREPQAILCSKSIGVLSENLVDGKSPARSSVQSIRFSGKPLSSIKTLLWCINLEENIGLALYSVTGWLLRIHTTVLGVVIDWERSYYELRTERKSNKSSFACWS